MSAYLRVLQLTLCEFTGPLPDNGEQGKLIRSCVNKSVSFNPRNNYYLGILQFLGKYLVSSTSTQVVVLQDEFLG